MQGGEVLGLSSEYVVGIDLGTTKVSVLIAEVSPDGEIRIIGAGTSPSDGIKKGVVVNTSSISSPSRAESTTCPSRTMAATFATAPSFLRGFRGYGMTV